MQVWSAIANIFAVLIMVSFVPIMHISDRTIERQFEQERLSIAVDYASEAAFMSTLEVENVELDYVDMAKVRINPSKSLDVFKSLICFSYDMSRDEENFQYIENFIPAAVIACNDGYYVAKMSEIDTKKNDDMAGGEYGLKWSLKLPYSVEANGKLYAVDLMDSKWCSVEESVVGGVQSVRFDQGESMEPGIDRELIQSVVSKKITGAMTKSILDRNKLLDDNGVPYNFYIPSKLTSSGINSISRPSFLIVMQDANLGGSVKVDTMSVGGVSTDRKRVVVGFKEGGMKYYCYERQLPKSLIGISDRFFDSIDEAAKEGYHPHYQYLGYRLRD